MEQEDLQQQRTFDFTGQCGREIEALKDEHRKKIDDLMERFGAPWRG